MPVFYSDKHIRILLDDGYAVLGLSPYAIKELKTIVFVNLPDAGEKIKAGKAFGDVESTKTVSDLIAPVSGVVAEVNEQLYDEPETLTAENWLVKVSDFRLDMDGLMDAEHYGKYVETL
ncbi:MAG: glycine cleavage system protein H [Butyrivibrio sp.]|nr:glycine cleavage system protein H [Acetatifactor muris]MCM1559372.1 glycine cleavage system protein H [Butyrivibrio sp.]